MKEAAALEKKMMAEMGKAKRDVSGSSVGQVVSLQVPVVVWRCQSTCHDKLALAVVHVSFDLLASNTNANANATRAMLCVVLLRPTAKSRKRFKRRPSLVTCCW